MGNEQAGEIERADCREGREVVGRVTINLKTRQTTYEVLAGQPTSSAGDGQGEAQQHAERVREEDAQWMERQASVLARTGLKSLAPLHLRAAAALRAAPVQQQDPETVWNAFHRAWTAAVGTPQYDKAVWLAASAQLNHAGFLAFSAAPPAQAAPGDRERAGWSVYRCENGHEHTSTQRVGKQQCRTCFQPAIREEVP